MDRTASLLLAAAVVICTVRNVTSLPPPPTVPTTPTTTTIPPEPDVIVSSGPIVHVSDSCLRCESGFDSYTNMLMLSNLAALSAVMDRLCHTDLPTVEQCLRNTGGGRCLFRPTPPRTSTYRFLCRHKTDVTNGVDCWSAGYPEAMAMCMRSFAASSRFATCQRARGLLGCVRSSLQRIPQCSASDISFIVDDYITFSLTFICGPQLPGL